MPRWRVRINIDVVLTIDAEKSADAESAALSRLITGVLNKGIVEMMDPRSVHSEEISYNEDPNNRSGPI